ncbi:MAG: hypothetical protein V3S97_05450 [Candidatus Bathyarchaeia archaeon]
MDTKKVASITVLSALYAIAILTIQIPSPTGGYTHLETQSFLWQPYYSVPRSAH